MLRAALGPSSGVGSYGSRGQRGRVAFVDVEAGHGTLAPGSCCGLVGTPLAAPTITALAFV